MEHPRCLCGRRERSALDRLQGAQPARHELLDAGACPPHPRRARTPSAFAARAAAEHSIPHLLLPRRLGLLPGAAGPRPPGAGPVRCLHRQHAGARPPELRRMRRARPQQRRGRDLHPCLPPFAGQRQPQRHGHRSGAGACTAPAATAADLALRVRARHHRFADLVVAQRAPAARHPRWFGHRLAGRRCAADLQAQPPRRHLDRPRGGARAGRLRRPRDAIRTLRLRRATVLLAGFRPALRPPDAVAQRHLPAVPHQRRRPGLRQRRRPGRRHPGAGAHRARGRRQPALHQPQPEGRAAAGQARPLRQHPRRRARCA